MMNCKTAHPRLLGRIGRGALLIALLLPFLGVAPTDLGAAVYFAARAGDDLNDGLTPETAWRTITRINTFPLVRGDMVLLRRGDVWREQLTVPSSGTAFAPIVFAAYGDGPMPRISGTVKTVPHRNAFRNGNFDEYRGAPDDGRSDDFLHFSGVGGRVEAVSEAPPNSGSSAVMLVKYGSRAILYSFVHLPPGADVSFSWKAKSIIRDGVVVIRNLVFGGCWGYASIGAFQSGTGQGEGTLSQHPGFVEPLANDFHPDTGSPLLDAGIDLGFSEDFEGRPIVAAPDIGALEWTDPPQ